MSNYRDDQQALRLRVEALERENQELRDEIARLRQKKEPAGILDMLKPKTDADRGDAGTCASCGHANEPGTAFCASCGCSDVF